MKLKNFLLVVLGVAGSYTSFAQSNLLNAKTPDEIGKKTAAQLESDNDKPLPYGYVHDRDVLMGKTIWEKIDLDERINFPLYYPVDTAFVGKDRRSLFQVLLNGIKSGAITEVYGDDYFNSKKSLKDMESIFKYKDTTPAGIDEFNTDIEGYKSGRKVLDPQYVNVTELAASDVSGYYIKGYWYFDKRQSELKYRLLGICPVATEARDKAKGNTDVIELFWIYFPSIRGVLHEAKAFNDKNSAMPITFDHLLNSRRFSGVIYKEENVYGDRTIEKYMKDNAQMQLLESERVKEKIRNFEQDMWNY
ncbi:MAG: gliding motility protein GldN [Flavobacteriaceae bacterium]|nr:gliding motility protein GldN [Flavobacteriaceae bacterium]